MSEEGGKAFITRRLKLKNGSIETTSVELTNVTEIDSTIGASLSEKGTIIYGVDNNFIIDLGTYKQYEVSFDRVTPDDYDDSSDRYKNQERWSNGHWYHRFCDLWDVWQNYTFNTDGELQGGLKFDYIPVDTSLYPLISTNVFLIGTISASFGVQRMKCKMTLLVARASLDEGVDQDLVDVRFALSSSVSYVKRYPIGAQMGLGTPPTEYLSELPQDGRAFYMWSYNGTTYSPESTVVVEEGMVFTAVWRYPEYTYVFAEPGTHELEIPSGVVRGVAYVIGGGGSGGRAFNSGKTCYSAGGGGGSGESTILNFTVPLDKKKLTVTVGHGGLYKEDGESSSIDLTGIPLVAGGGNAGADTNGDVTIVSKGGALYNSGGSTNRDLNARGGDGAYTQGMGVPGIGAYGDGTFQGGCGGGAADLNLTINTVSNCTTDTTLEKTVNVGWWYWKVIYEDDLNCTGSIETVSGQLGKLKIKCRPSSEGFYYYRAIVADTNNPYYTSRRTVVISGVHKASSSVVGCKVISVGGNGGRTGLKEKMGRLGGGGGSAPTVTEAAEGDYMTLGSGPGGDGFVAVSFFTE
jgi:hypothetical protein|nr:MAG TPA: hypothetical protein [Caudoviricetes sp.]